VSKKFSVLPGYITSKNDDDEHYIGWSQLIRLYGVKKEDCFIQGFNDPYRGWLADTIPLVPLSDGNYKEHLANLLKEGKKGNGK